MTDPGYAYIPGDFGEPEAAAVAADVPCRRCGYNVRGLPMDGRCPECGTPVGLSVRGGLIRYSDPAWIDRLRRGVICILTFAAVTVVVGVAAGCGAFGVALASGGRVTAASFQTGPWFLVLTAVGVANGAVYLVGLWLLTTPDPAGVGEDQYGGPRRLIRVTAVVGILHNGFNFLARPGQLPADLAPTATLAAGLAMVATSVATVATVVYLGRLALRLPDLDLSRRARMLTYGLGIPLGIAAVTTIAAGILTAAGPVRPSAAGLPAAFGVLVAVGCVGGIAGLVALGFYVVYLLMLIRFGTRFREQATLARQTWATAAPPPAS